MKAYPKPAPFSFPDPTSHHLPISRCEITVLFFNIHNEACGFEMFSYQLPDGTLVSYPDPSHILSAAHADFPMFES